MSELAPLQPSPIFMPDPISEAGDKGFDAAARDNARTLEPTNPGVPLEVPGQPSPAAMSALGINPATQVPGATPPAAPANDSALFKAAGLEPPPSPAPAPTVQPTHVDPAGKAVVENYSAVIQRAAEEAYATSLIRAKQDPKVIDAMLDSDLKEERAIAEKLLARNPELFGAGTAEEYTAKKNLEAAGNDPRDREIAQLKLDNAKRDAREADREWKAWKEKNGIPEGSSFEKLCDAVHKEYPNAPRGDIVSIARGRAGIKPLEPSPLDSLHVAPGGNRGAPADGGRQVDAGALSAFRLTGPQVQAADAYFEAIGGKMRGH